MIFLQKSFVFIMFAFLLLKDNKHILLQLMKTKSAELNFHLNHLLNQVLQYLQIKTLHLN